ncbi:MAG: hypothetical protein AVDCRST_MAG93-4381 [uncultured Chloroflexia bacterium]|uniref:Uncharacterized protein n=1 Tax=uncultured Chloroflexia bacterium TaxID=1672391 RepID=A0A6J4K7H1_9CHLR|nr:MAG: hypothetical protein AVDCRST_MAG93-4381 [uncultured Chloroflexia bacterium]
MRRSPDDVVAEAAKGLAQSCRKMVLSATYQARLLHAHAHLVPS